MLYDMYMKILNSAIKQKKGEEEIEELEGSISGTRYRKCVSIIPRF